MANLPTALDDILTLCEHAPHRIPELDAIAAIASGVLAEIRGAALTDEQLTGDGLREPTPAQIERAAKMERELKRLRALDAAKRMQYESDPELATNA